MNKEFFTNNRRRLKASAGNSAPIVIAANGLLQKSRDEAYPFYQDNNFWYLTGIDEPDAVLVIAEESDYLILPPRSRYLADFYGDINTKVLKDKSGIDEVLSYKAGWQKLKRSQGVATTLPPSSRMSQLGMYTNPAARRLVEKLKSHNRNIKITDIRPQLSRLRAIKTSEETKAISQAADETIKLHKLLAKNIAKYKQESEIIAEIRSYGAKRQLELAYPPIVASGKNACVLHYENGQAKIDPSRPLLIDAALCFGRYRSDVTRTHLPSPTKQQKNLYKIVLNAQEYAISRIKPGIKLEQIERETRRQLGKYAGYFSHRSTHFLGLDAHDPGDYSQPLQPGMVLTVEPGIYIPEESIGIRIEDTVLVTENGREVLSGRLPK